VLLRAAPGVVLLAACVALLAVPGEDTARAVVAIAVGGIGAIWLAFFEIGRSEDRERARRGRARPPAAGPDRPTRPPRRRDHG
jgi:hypothetical protein